MNLCQLYPISDLRANDVSRVSASLSTLGRSESRDGDFRLVDWQPVGTEIITPPR